ncbi:MAG TPA: methylated-DNA--[protein]-cysteine S-methyltransferase [Thermoanaerobaculaceae bacterium]|nr:methylated-DNA--[protein]-cysteine S-methyltransferase [Thermoanaerobaculaceae bacterium]
MSASLLPDGDTMYRALLDKDPAFDGLFFTGVTTTGVFCRPTCTARKPKRENVVFFPTAHEALTAGYRPCRICRPFEPPAATPDAVRALLAEVEARPGRRLSDADLRARGIDPAGLRRWFRRNHGMTFQGYVRALRVGAAFAQIEDGESPAGAGFDQGWESLSGFAEAFRKVAGAPPTRAGGLRVTVSRVETPLGPMFAGATSDGVCLLEFVDRRRIERQLGRLRSTLDAVLTPGASPHLDALERELREYFAGTLREFATPLDVRGTEFQRRVWAVLREVPYGQTRSYAEQAQRFGDPQAIRAVAHANGDNPISIVIPCHRVVGADGSLTGYGGGLWRKGWLLDHERQVLAMERRR